MGDVRWALAVPLILLAPACSSGNPATTEGSSLPSATTTPSTAPTGTQEEPVAALSHVKLTKVASGLEAPLDLVSTAAEPDRLYVVEQAGRIRVIENGRLLPEPFLDIRTQVRSGGEQGLLSVAFHPDYADNGRFYVDYTDLNGDTRVVEYEKRAGEAPARQRELLFVDQPYANHNGGELAFGPDARLYVGMGDGGSGGDPEDRAQNLDEQLGKLLSLDVDRTGAGWRVDGYGLRNPWRFSFDRETRDLWIGDVGQGEWEEIDYTPWGSAGLENYGWNVYEGRHVYEDKEPNPRGRLVAPVAEYSHEKGCSVTGGFVYRGERIPAARGRYFYGDFCSGRVWSLMLRNGKAAGSRLHSFRVDALSSFGEDGAGELYLVSLEGRVYRLDPR
jgi:glucose/arabinose dehydrogenase